MITSRQQQSKKSAGTPADFISQNIINILFKTFNKLLNRKKQQYEKYKYTCIIQ